MYELSRLWEKEFSQLPEDAGKKLLLYCTFLKCYCSQQHIPVEYCERLEGSLSRLFQREQDQTLREAAEMIEAVMPWKLVESNSKLKSKLVTYLKQNNSYFCATREWLQRKIDSIFELDGFISETVVTPASIRELVAKLAAQEPAGRIVDLCSGTFSLGAHVWREMGTKTQVSCVGEEIDRLACAISRVFLHLYGVRDFFVHEKDVRDLSFYGYNADDETTVFVADLPMAGNRTYAVPFHNSILGDCSLHSDQNQPNDSIRMYLDWALIQSIILRMKKNDRAFLLVTKGALVRKNEKNIREELVKNDWLEGVVTLPRGLYPNHSLPIELLICRKEKPKEKCGRVFFADLSGFSSPNNRRTHRLDQAGITQCCELFLNFESLSGISGVAPLEKICKKEYDLQPATYLVNCESASNCVLLKDIAEVTRGWQQAKCCDEFGNRSGYLLNIRDLDHGEICYEGADRIASRDWEAGKKYQIQEDDIILTSKGTTLKIAIVPPAPPIAFISGNLTLLRVKENKYPAYVLYEYLSSPKGRAALDLIQTGTTIRVLGSGKLAQLEIPCYDETSLFRIGIELKALSVQYHDDIRNLNASYKTGKKNLLAGLGQREEQQE